jgi:3-oxoadipate enol-lactonase
MTTNGAVHEMRVALGNTAGRVHVGGAGQPIVLVHGGWSGGAAMHWSAAWDLLAARFQVIAPDLPGLSREGEAGLGSVAAYARFVEAVVERMASRPAWIVGHSFGAAIAWRVAADAPRACAGLVLVNGFPMPRTPAPLAWLARLPGSRERLARWVRRRSSGPAALARAFAAPSRIPGELTRAVLAPDPRQLLTFAGVLLAGDPGEGRPAVRPVLLWGDRDRLRRTSAADARRLARQLDATLVLVPGAGHAPQLERPDLFADALERIVGGTPAVAGEGRRSGTA